MYVITTFRKIGLQQQWFAEIENRPHTHVEGKTQSEAVGRLVVAKARRLNIQIKRDTDRDLLGVSDGTS